MRQRGFEDFPAPGYLGLREVMENARARQEQRLSLPLAFHLFLGGLRLGGEASFGFKGFDLAFDRLALPSSRHTVIVVTDRRGPLGGAWLGKSRAGTGEPGRAERRPRLSRLLDYGDFFGLQALGTLRHQEFDVRAFIEAAIAARLDRRVMHKDILAALALDEAKTFGRIEPLHYTFFFFSHIQMYLFCFELFELLDFDRRLS
jgi:hypothetical protein